MEIVTKKQLKKGLALFLLVWGAAIGYQIAQALLAGVSKETLALHFTPSVVPYLKPSFRILSTLICAITGYFLSSPLAKIFTLTSLTLENLTRKFSWQELSSIALGMILGLVVANLLALPLWDIPFGKYPAVVINLILGLLGGHIFLKRRRDIKPKENGGLDRDRFYDRPWEPAGKEAVSKRKVLDTSVIIDGRILDVARTGFLDGNLIIPEFVLHELQGIADSSDPLRRMRGRRGLDVVSELQALEGIAVEIFHTTIKNLGEDSVDSALISLAKQLASPILTTDYNLLKVAQIQDVLVLNINDLANAIKPLLLPGDFIEIDVIREGKDNVQGVGYLNDGTMCVVEDGAPFIGHKIGVMVTSMLQTSAGRMIFGRASKEVAKA